MPTPLTHAVTSSVISRQRSTMVAPLPCSSIHCAAVRASGVYPSFLPPDARLPAVATRDVAAPAARCLLEPPPRNQIIHVTGPSYSAREAAELLGRALGRALQVVHVPPERHIETLTAGGLPADFPRGARRDVRLRVVGAAVARGRLPCDRGHAARGDPALAPRRP